MCVTMLAYANAIRSVVGFSFVKVAQNFSIQIVPNHAKTILAGEKKTIVSIAPHSFSNLLIKSKKHKKKHFTIILTVGCQMSTLFRLEMAIACQ